MAITKSIRKKKRNNSRRKSRGGEQDYTADNANELLNKVNIAQAMRVKRMEEAQERVRQMEAEHVRQKHQTDLEKLVSQIIRPDGIIYICCLLDDLVIVDFLKYIVGKNRTSEHKIRVWLQINPYNVGVGGGKPWLEYREKFFKLMQRVDNNLTSMPELKKVGIYAVNPVELNNIDNIASMLAKYDSDRPQPNAFGINKLYKLLLKQTGRVRQIGKPTNIEDKPIDITFMSDSAIEKLEASNDSSNELVDLVKLFNTIVDKIASAQSLQEWKNWVKKTDLLSNLMAYENLIVRLGDGGTYTQILKTVSSLKAGPQLSNDWLGMMVAAYIMTKKNSNEPEVFNPVGNAKLDPNQTDFMNYLATNRDQISENEANFPDMIIHDGEEDDILTVQFAKRIAKSENRDLLTVMQTSPTNAWLKDKFEMISGNEKMISFQHFDSATGLPKDMANVTKVALAIDMCVKSDIWKNNCFAKSVSTGGLSKKLHNYHKKYTSKKRYKKIRTIKKKRARKF